MSAVKILLSWKIKNKLAVREEMKVKILAKSFFSWKKICREKEGRK